MGNFVQRDGFGSAAEIESIDRFDAAWQVRGHGPRLSAVRKAAEDVRNRFVFGARALCVRSLPITTLAYPTKYAFWGAAYSPAPYVVMTHRALLVQFHQRGQLKTLLFNPTDDVASRETPYFKRMIRQVGDYVAFNLLAKKFDSLEHQLSQLGLAPGDIDYVAFDHFHTQDLRSLLGTKDGEYASRFPKAKLLAPAVEWDDWDDLHPMQRAWFVADGKKDVRTENVVLTEGDFWVGDGVLLLSTPGHTSGNQTLFINTSDGVWGCSENGTCADSWTPIESRIRGLSGLCRRQDMDVILNANTPELGATQYTSMVLERTLVDRLNSNPGFCQMFPSSEVTPSPISMGLRPTVVHGNMVYGEVTRVDTRVAPREASWDRPVVSAE
ncbi:MAG TPA: hypothetical protein PKD61_24470 [Polyangiaceae bacterium]|nr:hypothetical protein [Polyangiaceae bacterium]